MFPLKQRLLFEFVSSVSSFTFSSLYNEWSCLTKVGWELQGAFIVTLLTTRDSSLFEVMQMMVNECLQLRSTGIVVWETDFQPTSQLQTPSRLSPSHTYNFSSRNVGSGLGVSRAMYKLCDDMTLSCPAQQFESVLVFSLKQVQRDRLFGMRYVKANQLIACLDPWHDLFLTWIHLKNQSFCSFPQIRFANFMSFASFAWSSILLQVKAPWSHWTLRSMRRASGLETKTTDQRNGDSANEE